MTRTNYHHFHGTPEEDFENRNRYKIPLKPKEIYDFKQREKPINNFINLPKDNPDFLRSRFSRENDEPSRLEREGKEYDARIIAVCRIKNQYYQMVESQRRVFGEDIYQKLVLRAIEMFDGISEEARRNHLMRTAGSKGLRESLTTPLKIDY